MEKAGSRRSLGLRNWLTGYQDGHQPKREHPQVHGRESTIRKTSQMEGRPSSPSVAEPARDSQSETLGVKQQYSRSKRVTWGKIAGSSRKENPPSRKEPLQGRSPGGQADEGAEQEPTLASEPNAARSGPAGAMSLPRNTGCGARPTCTNATARSCVEASFLPRNALGLEFSQESQPAPASLRPQCIQQPPHCETRSLPSGDAPPQADCAGNRPGLWGPSKLAARGSSLGCRSGKLRRSTWGSRPPPLRGRRQARVPAPSTEGGLRRPRVPYFRDGPISPQCLPWGGRAAAWAVRGEKAQGGRR